MQDLCEELGESRSTIDKWRARGSAPRCVKLPNGHLRFDVDEVYAWLDDLTAAR
jgi:predicted DNA-binding transcriptional regulator AlpA